MEHVKFQDWALAWVGEKRNFVKESTYANYVIGIRNHLIPQIGEYVIEGVTREVVQKMILELRMTGRRDGKGGLSDKTVKDLIVILKTCLRDGGVEEPWIYQKNALHFPIDNSIKEMDTMDEEMYCKMICAIKKELDCETLGYALSLYTGMRIGEVCALQWKDIDMKRQKIYVTKTLQRVYFKDEVKGRTEIIIGTPKSRAAVREIPISRALEELLFRGICEKECYVVSGNRRYVEPRLYRKHYMDFLGRNGLEHIKFHGLRHTFATRCIEKGGDYKTVSCLLGHASVNMTLNRYVHPQLEQKRRCVELISANG